MKKIRTTIITMSLLTLSLGTLGFSTWLYGQSNSVNGKVDVQFGDLVSKGNLFKLLKVENFAICKDGIIDNGKIVDKGKVTFNLELDNTNAIENNLVSNNEIMINCDLRCTNLDTFITSAILVENSIPEFNIFPKITFANYHALSNFTIQLSSGQFTKFSIAYTFSGNFFNDLASITNPRFILDISGGKI